jgi:pyrimidine operon attenuation protein/uracil phosphoribosyltransferase
MAEQHILMDSREIASALKRMAREIRDRNGDCTDLVLMGVQRAGVTLAKRLARLLEKELGRPVPVGTLDVAMHRDDLDQRLAPHVHPTHIPGDITGKVVVLVDDVLFSGRTTRAALDALNDFGRARRVQLAVLVDRGHRELPIRADFVGKNVPTAPADHIEMRLDDEGGEDAVYLLRP